MEEQAEFSPFDHELSFGELFDWTWKIAARNYVRVLPLFIIVGVFASLVSYAFSPVTVVPNINLTTTNSSSISALSNAIAPAIRWLSNVYFESFLIFLAIYFGAGIALSMMDKDWRAKSGQHVATISGKLNYAALAITTFLATAIIFLGSLLIVIGALVLGTYLYLSLVASSVEGKSAFQSLGRSGRLISGRWGKTFLTMIGTFLFVYFVGSAAGIIAFAIVPNSALQGVVTFFVMAILSPVIASSMLVLYYSNRQRQARQVMPFSTPPARSPYDSMRPAPIGVFGSQASQEVRFCSQCGVRVSPEEKFCHNCGKQQAQ